MKPIITDISLMERDKLPDWCFDDRDYYHLTINGKKCYFCYKDDNNCMLYVDGYKVPGFNVDNAIYDRYQYKELFGMGPDKFDPYIFRAIKDWKFRQMLSPDTLNTFGDLIDEL